MGSSPNPVPSVPRLDLTSVSSRQPQDQLVIRVSKGSGVGPTRLAAFDLALFAAGIAGYNILRLSSVIPPHAVVREVPATEQIQGTEGDVAYCVYAAAYASKPGEQAWAGVAWAVNPHRSNAGLFVEHAASSESTVRWELDATVAAMSLTRGNQYRKVSQTISSAVCVDDPVCAVVIATYGTADWSQLLNSEG
jgi:arginine decarboxylase